jgi:hypothetical protein
MQIMSLPEHTTYWNIPGLLGERGDMTVARIADPAEVWYIAGPAGDGCEPEELVGAVMVDLPPDDGRGMRIVEFQTHGKADVYTCRAAASVIHCAVVAGEMAGRDLIYLPEDLTRHGMQRPVWRSLMSLTFSTFASADMFARAEDIRARVPLVYPTMKEMHQVNMSGTS